MLDLPQSMLTVMCNLLLRSLLSAAFASMLIEKEGGYKSKLVFLDVPCDTKKGQGLRLKAPQQFCPGFYI